MISNASDAIQKYLTPFKYGKPVIAGSGREGAFDRCSVDIPFVFYHQGKFWMMYTGYDGTGYQTAFATSRNLLDWEFRSLVLKRSDSAAWDSIGASGTWIIKESDDIFDLPRLKKIYGKYWMIYHSYPAAGYETGPAEIGLAYTEDEDLLEWHRFEKPVFSWRNGAKWECGGLYKASVIQYKDMFYMFYNAKTRGSSWVEQTGVAMSHDLLEWERYKGNPVLKITDGGWDSKFLSDPCIVRDKGLWLNFYFAYDMKHAQEGLAISKDLFNWEKVENPIVRSGEPGELDETHAHKAAMVFHEHALYHFYCAVRPCREGDATNVHGEFRTISVACSKQLGNVHDLSVKGEC